MEKSIESVLIINFKQEESEKFCKLTAEINDKSNNIYLCRMKEFSGELLKVHQEAFGKVSLKKLKCEMIEQIVSEYIEHVKPLY